MFVRCTSNNNSLNVVFTTCLQVVLTVQKKGFDYHDRHSELFGNNRTWVGDGSVDNQTSQPEVCEVFEVFS